MKENTIYFKPSKRVKFARSFNHALVGVLLVILGMESLSHRETEHLVFALLGIEAARNVILEKSFLNPGQALESN